MWDMDKKDVLKIIYGEDLELIHDVVIARSPDSDVCKVINQDGELLINEDVLGIGTFLGPGGFHYVLITDKKVVNEGKTRRGSYVSPAANSKYYSNYQSVQRMGFNTPKTTVYTEYKYKIYSSTFDYESVGTSRVNSELDAITIDFRGAAFHFKLDEKCKLCKYNEYLSIGF